MSKFNQYAKRLNETAQEAFMQYKKAEMNLKRTGETVKDWDAEKIAGNDYE